MNFLIYNFLNSLEYFMIVLPVLATLLVILYLRYRDLKVKQRVLNEKNLEIRKQHASMEFQISLAQKYIEREKLKQKELKQEIEFKNKQLTSYALNFEQKNRIIIELQEVVKKIEVSSTPVEKKEYVKELKKIAKENLTIDKNWECFRQFFQETQYGFHAKLLAKHPNLKANDLKLCSVIRLNLCIKETADVLGISPGSLKTSRYRLRKKLNLPSNKDIIDYLISFERDISIDKDKKII
ncbi:helix-turn-helix transcriptional regulator [Abyssalbus ytuae]|uniref:HTH luxR-type domain-containing protein n=1 Tax=Abyssalbus ytuae TaxID=2926907 RepID=A0A9E7CSR2_9FLAO|nr:hypothetical protein [Abyssalbus ytuae]UOB16691.1 hypothetical protein MQE35_13205 [Abyssalbus ytuae]